jgi:hypothetical protein
MSRVSPASTFFDGIWVSSSSSLIRLLLPPPLLLVYSAGTSNPDALQDQRELDAVEKEALVQPMGTHLHQIAEKAKGKGTLRHNTVQKLGPGNRYTV